MRGFGCSNASDALNWDDVRELGLYSVSCKLAGEYIWVNFEQLRVNQTGTDWVIDRLDIGMA